MRIAAALVAAALLACADPREAELAKELAALQESRTSKAAVDRLAQEAEQAESAAAAVRNEIASVEAGIAELEAASAAAEAAYQRELERNRALHAAIEAGNARLNEKTAREAALEQELEIARTRARTFKDQAAVLVRELRPDDPLWAQRLRVAALREFLASVRETWPGDPVLADAASPELPSDERAAARAGAERAARVRDRVSEVYGLAEEPAVAAPGGATRDAVAAEPPGPS